MENTASYTKNTYVRRTYEYQPISNTHKSSLAFSIWHFRNQGIFYEYYFRHCHFDP